MPQTFGPPAPTQYGPPAPSPVAAQTPVAAPPQQPMNLTSPNVDFSKSVPYTGSLSAPANSDPRLTATLKRTDIQDLMKMGHPPNEIYQIAQRTDPAFAKYANNLENILFKEGRMADVDPVNRPNWRVMALNMHYPSTVTGAPVKLDPAQTALANQRAQDTEDRMVKMLREQGQTPEEAARKFTTGNDVNQTNDPTRSGTNELAGYIGKPTTIDEALGSGIKGGILGSKDMVVNTAKSAYGLVTHLPSAMIGMAALPAGAVEETLSRLFDPFLSDKHKAPNTWERQQFMGLMKQTGIADFVHGMTSKNADQSLTGLDQGINYAYQHPAETGMAFEGAVRGLNKLTGSDFTTPSEAGGSIVKGTGDAIKTPLKALAEKVNGAPLPTDQNIISNYSTAVVPSTSNLDTLYKRNSYQSDIVNGTKSLVQNAKDLGIQELPTTKEAAAAMNQKMLTALGQGMENIGKTADANGVTVTTQGIADSLREFANGKSVSPTVKAWARAEALRYGKMGELPVSDAIDLRQQLEKMSGGMTSTPEDASRVGALNKAKMTLDQDINDSITNHNQSTGQMYSELNKEYSMQKTLQSDLNQAAAKEQFAPKGSNANALKKGASVAKSLVTGHPVRALGQFGQIATDAAMTAEETRAMGNAFKAASSAIDPQAEGVLSRLNKHLESMKTTQPAPAAAPQPVIKDFKKTGGIKGDGGSVSQDPSVDVSSVNKGPKITTLPNGKFAIDLGGDKGFDLNAKGEVNSFGSKKSAWARVNFISKSIRKP